MTWEEFCGRCPFELNQQQTTAVRRDLGRTLLLAVPGSGKTTVILARVGYLIFCKGVAPENILTVTFSVAATEEMSRRFRGLFGEELAKRVQFRTIHGLCAMILHHWSRQYGRELFHLMDSEGEIFDLLRELYREEFDEAPEEGWLRDFQRELSFARNRRLSDDEIRPQTAAIPGFFRLRDAYARYKLQNRCMDYDDLLHYALTVLRKYPDVLEKYRAQYPFVNVDEAQDTSKIQFDLLFLLTQTHKNLFLVGDEDQSIYGFRAASPEILAEFEKIFPDAKILLMEQNYRAGQKLVDCANRFIAKNQNRHPKTMVGREFPAEIETKKFATTADLYQYLENEAKNPSQTAILYRNNDSALPLLDRLERAGTEFSFHAGDGAFFAHWMTCDLRDMLGLAFAPNDEAFLRVYHKWNTFLTREMAETAVKLRQEAPETTYWKLLLRQKALDPDQKQQLRALQTFYGLLPRHATADVLDDFLYRFGYWEKILRRGREENKLRVLRDLAAQNPDPAGFLTRLEELSALSQTDRSVEGAACILSTVHSAKGLEFDRVILIDARDGILPTWESAEEMRLPPEDWRALEEERRIFYVAATRARKKLELVTLKGTQNSFVREFLGLPLKGET